MLCVQNEGLILHQDLMRVKRGADPFYIHDFPCLGPLVFSKHGHQFFLLPFCQVWCNHYKEFWAPTRNAYEKFPVISSIPTLRDPRSMVLIFLLPSWQPFLNSSSSSMERLYWVTSCFILSSSINVIPLRGLNALDSSCSLHPYMEVLLWVS